MEISVQKIVVFVELLSQLFPLSASADFGQKTVLFHKSKDCLCVLVTTIFVQPELHPAIAIGVFALLLLLCDLVYDRLIWVWTVQMPNVGIIPASGNAKELAHPANGIFLPMAVNHRILCLGSHFLPVDCRKSRSSLFSIFNRSISYLYSAILGSRISPFRGRPLGLGAIPAASFFCFRLYRVRNPRISLCVKPSFSPIARRVIPWPRSSRISLSCA